MSHGSRWRLADPEIIWEQWPHEQEVTAFSPRSGNIHLLTTSARLLLEQIAKAPQTAAELREFLEASAGIPAALIDEAFPELITVLHDAELIELVD